MSLRARGMIYGLVAEAFACAAGFVTTIHLARVLQPRGFATLESALAPAAWLLVLVRGGLDQIVVREAARRPAIVGRLTSLLIWLRLGWAALGLILLAVLAVMRGGEQAWPILACGLLLVPAALSPDVRPRAIQFMPFLASVVVLRATGILVAAMLLVRNPEQVGVAALVASAIEALIALVTIAHEGWPSFRLPTRRSVLVFSRRAMVAGLTRFGRVGLYLVDLLMLGWANVEGAGPYAAARKIVIALAGIGMVVPTLLGPTLARERTQGVDAASRVVGNGVSILIALFLPASLGLLVLAPRGLPMLFGAGYDCGGWALLLLVARLPVLLVASWLQTATVSLGDERKALRLMVILLSLSLFLLPSGASFAGIAGIAAVVLVLETIAVMGAWSALRSRGVTFDFTRQLAPAFVGSLAMTAAIWPLRSASIVPVIVLGVLIYSATWCAMVRVVPGSFRKALP